MNPDGTAPNNIAYSFAQDCLQDLVLFDFYDVAKYNGSNLDSQTSIGYMSFCKLMDIMKIFNVKLVIDDGQVRLEHVSYFDDDEIGLDLTTADYEKFLTEIKWKYKSLDIPYKETYQFNKRESRDFPNCEITYDCSPNMNNEDISVSCIDFDLGAIQVLPEDEVGNGDEQSWVLLALDENGKIKNDSGLLNNPFSYENLIRKLHVYDKPAQYGYIDGERVEMESMSNVREISKIAIPLCCEDFHNFENQLEKKVKVPCLDELATIDKATYNSFNEMLTLNLTF